jgi:hypothetical protein
MTVPLTKPTGSPCKAPAHSEDLALNKKNTIHACKSTWVCSISIFAKHAINSIRIVMFTGKLVSQS